MQPCGFAAFLRRKMLAIFQIRGNFPVEKLSVMFGVLLRRGQSKVDNFFTKKAVENWIIARNGGSCADDVTIASITWATKAEWTVGGD